MRSLLFLILMSGVFTSEGQTCRVILDAEATYEVSYFDCFGSTNMHLSAELDRRSDPAKFRLLDKNFKVLEDFEDDKLETDYREGQYYIEARLDSSRANCTFQNRNVGRDTIPYMHEEISPDPLLESDITVTQISDCGASDGVIVVTQWSGIEYRVAEVSPVWRSGGTFRNLSGGSYRVTIRDRRTRCESNTVTVQILEPSPQLDDEDITITHPSACGVMDGSISLNLPNGVEVNFENGGWTSQERYENLSAGTYTLTLRNPAVPECISAPYDIVLNATAPPNLNANQVMVDDESLCLAENGSIAINHPLSGLEYGLNGTWSTSNTFTDLAPGNYEVQVRSFADAACESNTINVEVKAADAPILTANQVDKMDESVCGAADGSITIANQGNGIEYGLNGTFGSERVFEDLGPGSYELQLRVSSAPDCVSSIVTIAITSADAPKLDINMVDINDESQCGAADGSITIDNQNSVQYGINGTFGNTRSFEGLTPGTYVLALRSVADENCLSAPLEVEVLASGAPQLRASEIEFSAEENCGGNDGAIEVTSALTDVEYGLNGSFSATSLFQDLAPGFYDVQIQIAGQANCASAPITIFIDSVPRPSIRSNDFIVQNVTDCGESNGSVRIINGTGLEFRVGDGDFTDDIVTGLPAGKYPLQARYLGNDACLSNKVEIDIIEPGAPSLFEANIETVDPTECGASDGAITFVGISGDMETSIDNGETFSNTSTYAELGAGVYLVLIRDPNGCKSATLSVDLFDAGAPQLTLDDFFVLGESSCGAQDGSITVNDTDYEFQIVGLTDFAQDAFDLAAGSYEVEYRLIDVPDCSNFIQIDVQFSEGQIILKFPGSLNMLVYPDSSLEYVWGTMVNGNFNELPPEKNDRQFYLLEDAYNPGTTYAVQLFCGDAIDVVTFDGPPIDDAPTVMLFPNPAIDEIHITGTDKEIVWQYRILDALGATHKVGVFPIDGVHRILVSSLPSGTYFLALESTEKGTHFIKPFIKTK
ncbi:MAG: T9SS type A sorting domain-containing protein [Saprospiraceae bacterium]|nr:T9SS type A sorting domain-containing protein [Saprospiraceae bacterium]